MKYLLLSLLFSASVSANAQKPKDGVYTYKIAFAEWQGQSLGTTCTVIIKGNKIKILSNGTGRLTAKKGDVLEDGIIIRHSTGKWIVGHSTKDRNAEEIGGCTGGPPIIDFKHKIFWMC